MLLVFQVPFADARDFVSVDTYQLKKPDWLNINPDLRNDFIHKIGVVERNRNSKIDWTSSEVSCRAKKIFSFDEEAIKRLSRGNRGMVLHSRRLFPTEIREIGKDENGEIISFQNKAIGSMEIGFIHSSRKNFQQNPLSAEELSGIVKSCLNLKVDVKLKDKERISCRLYDITKYLGEIYLYATTKKTMRDKCCKWWVDVGAPMLVVMYRGSEVNEYPKDAKFIMNIKERKIRIYFGEIKIYKSIYIKAWYIVSYGDAKQRDVKTLMEGLLHINSSRQCLNRILNHYEKIDLERGTESFEKFNRYLEFTFASIFKRKRFGFPCKEFADILMECDEAVDKTLREGIMNKFGEMGIRGNYLRHLEKYMKERRSVEEMVVDVLILTAVEDEFKVIYQLETDWKEEKDRSGYSYYVREMEIPNNKTIKVGLASADMGEVNITNLATRLSNELKPECLAMAGICAGWRKKVKLGDVIVAERVFKYDSGKLISFENGEVSEEQVFNDIRTYNLNPVWRQNAKNMGDEWKKTIAAERPVEYTSQELWVLKTIRDYSQGNAKKPVENPQRKEMCPDWTDVIGRLEEKGLISIDEDIRLTDEGSKKLIREEYMYPDGHETCTDVKVHIAPIGTGSKVIEDRSIFPKISKDVRSVLGLEMEGAAVGAVAELEHIKNFIVVKAVSDYADEEKDDHFRMYAIEGSYRFLVAFLKKIYTTQ